MDSGASPEELWTRSTTVTSRLLSDCHVWGSPTYVLEQKVQKSGVKIPKWRPRSRWGVNMGFSPHTRLWLPWCWMWWQAQLLHNFMLFSMTCSALWHWMKRILWKFGGDLLIVHRVVWMLWWTMTRCRDSWWVANCGWATWEGEQSLTASGYSTAWDKSTTCTSKSWYWWCNWEYWGPGHVTTSTIDSVGNSSTGSI